MTGGLVLGVDTSTVVNVGLARDGQVLGRATVPDRLAHVEQLTPLVRQVLAGAGLSLADLDHLVVGLGPGPFTGLRVGIATARVLAAVRGIPLRGVCSLDVLAIEYAGERQHTSGREHTAGWKHTAERGERAVATAEQFLVATDARRHEVYWARYAADGTRLDGPRVTLPAEVPALPVVGPGAALYPEQLEAVLGPTALDPGVLAGRGLALADAGLEPLYLRRPDAALPARRKSVLTFRAGGDRS